MSWWCCCSSVPKERSQSIPGEAMNGMTPVARRSRSERLCEVVIKSSSWVACKLYDFACWAEKHEKEIALVILFAVLIAAAWEIIIPMVVGAKALEGVLELAIVLFFLGVMYSNMKARNVI